MYQAYDTNNCSYDRLVAYDKNSRLQTPTEGILRRCKTAV